VFSRSTISRARRVIVSVLCGGAVVSTGHAVHATDATPSVATRFPATPIAARQTVRSDFPVNHAHSQRRQHGIASTADVADFRGSRGQVPRGSGSLGTDHTAAAEGDDVLSGQ
jgi:hypothetical protein